MKTPGGDTQPPSPLVTNGDVAAIESACIVSRQWRQWCVLLQEWRSGVLYWCFRHQVLLRGLGMATDPNSQYVDDRICW